MNFVYETQNRLFSFPGAGYEQPYPEQTARDPPESLALIFYKYNRPELVQTKDCLS